ncbi:MAG: choice-of-anchor J domain-containing protein [Breznakibacter sp.]
MELYYKKTGFFKQALLLAALILLPVAGLNAQSATLPSEVFDNWHAYSVAGDKQWTFSGTNAAMLNDYLGGGTSEEEDWLVSPEFTAGDGYGIGLNFTSWYSGIKNPIAVKYSTGYSGEGDPNTATWTDITDKAQWGGSSAETKASGNVIIAESLPLRIAFVYTGDSVSWKLSGIKVDNIDAMAPTTPANLTAATTEAGILLTWDASTDNTDVTGYHIYINDKLYKSTETPGYTIASIPANAEYTIDVEAFDAAGNKSGKATVTHMLSSRKPASQCDYSDDFTSLTFTGTGFAVASLQTLLTTPNGWTGQNVIMVKGPNAGASGGILVSNYKAMNTGEQGFCLNGTTTKTGVISSPVLGGGCATIFFNYAARNTSTRRIQVTIEQEGEAVWSDTLDINVYQVNTRCEYLRKNIGVAGNFRLKIKNLCPSQISTNTISEDATIWNVCLQTQVTEVATPEITIEGKRQSENIYWEQADVTLSTETRDCNLYYTVDGTEPTSASTPYTDTFTLTKTATVKAIAVHGGLVSQPADAQITVAGPQTAILPYSESFASGLGNWYFHSAVGEQEWIAGSEGETSFARMWGAPDEYTVVANEDWLISPALTAAEGYGLAFRFASSKQYDGNAIALKYSTDYAGVGDPSTATWTDITAQAVLPTTEAVWMPSGVIAISETAPVRFAFVYTSTVSEAALWQVSHIGIVNADLTVPSAPAGLTGLPAVTGIDLSWTASTDNVGVAGYNVYVGEELEGTTAETSYAVTGLTSATGYVLGVEAFDAAGNKSAKAYVTATTGTATGLPKNTASGLSVYPNPFDGFVIVTVPVSNRAVVYNQAGCAVLNVPLNAGENRINTSALPSGVYILQCGTDIVKMMK